MTTWRQGSSHTWECKSIGCAIGHVTAIATDAEKVLFSTYMGGGFHYISFPNVSKSMFNIGSLHNTEYDVKLWDFLFSEKWSINEGDPKEEFLGRLDYFLKNEDIPEEYSFEDSFAKTEE